MGVRDEESLLCGVGVDTGGCGGGFVGVLCGGAAGVGVELD